MTKLTFAMRAFLGRVYRGEVYRVAGYTKRRGGYERFRGGEATAKRANTLGLINMPGIPQLGRPTIATLTHKGRAALNSAALASLSPPVTE